MELEGPQAAAVVLNLASSAASSSMQYLSGWDARKLATIVASGTYDDIAFTHPLCEGDHADDDDTAGFGEGATTAEQGGGDARAGPEHEHEQEPTSDTQERALDDDLLRRRLGDALRPGVELRIAPRAVQPLLDVAQAGAGAHANDDSLRARLLNHASTGVGVLGVPPLRITLNGVANSIALNDANLFEDGHNSHCSREGGGGDGAHGSSTSTELVYTPPLA